VVQESAPLPLLTTLLGQGITRLFVNPGFTTVRWYAREELERMVALLGGNVAATAPATGDPALHTAAGGDLARGAAAPAGGAAARARRYAVPPMIPPPGRADEASHQVARALSERAQKEQVPIWEYVRLLGGDLDLYVQLLPGPVDGTTWPQRFKDTKDADRSVLYAYTREDRMRAAMAKDPPDEQRFQRLAGVELMRWLWAAPKPADEVYINAYKGSDAFLPVPGRWALSIVYPHYLDVDRLEAVPTVPLPRLAALPGVRGLQAEVVKAMVQGWKHLLGTRRRDGGAVQPVERDGGRWLPVFTTDEQFFAFGSTDRSFDGVPVRADRQPPFGRWLGATQDCDGIVVDPAAPRPLTLDHTDLLLLELWSRVGSQPRGPELAKAVALLRADDLITPRVAARIVADWPEWYVGIQRKESEVAVLALPDRETLPIFPTADALGAFVAHHRTAGRLSGSWEAMGLVHRWTGSVFEHVGESYRGGACIAPAADGSGGLALDAAMLDAVMQRLHERLTPRVPGFVAEG
jgi:hypothetical protein